MGQTEGKGKETSVDRNDHDQTLEYQQINRRLTEQYRCIDDERKRLQKEKDEAERRLGKLMSAKIYDNNPAIADLSDPYRPTKLADQFSSLYDNEWTDAFDVLQNLNCSEQQTVQILLDLVMESYEFCRGKIDATWAFVQKWFLVKDISSVETIKAFKDGRKQKSVDNIPEIQEEFYLHVCELFKSEDMMNELVNSKPLKKYINECIRLCLMMNACDPPVFIEIPGWKPFKERSGKVASSTERGHTYSVDKVEDGSWRCNEHANIEPEQITRKEHTVGPDDDEQTRTYQTVSMTCDEKLTQTLTTDNAFECGQNKIENSGASHIELIGTNVVKRSTGGVARDGRDSTESKVEILNSNTGDSSGKGQEDTGIKVDKVESNTRRIANGRQEIIETKVDEVDTNARDITCDRQESARIKVVYIESAPQHITNEATNIVETMNGSNSNASTSLLNKTRGDVNSLIETSVKGRNDGEPVFEAKSDKHDSSIVESSDIDECFEAREHNVDMDVNIRPEFDTNKYREYTHRGKYVEYYVWPVVYLHQNGAALSRGIAQCTNYPSPCL
ncbi:uncharacterized protein LOC127850501 isoform X1 [Dreissena polymorpha]|uniref:Mitochondria-eating protein C-terminal domain-containing protein n=2 Tax=Dreissena polymorpha TaxID=45954 RepID=A0A9D4D2X4_DREPO|nr:uncharacterized protein LOC127850501 isoform X1 [Dreissena polymorpha]KAH3737822.1 hypothetical protein DPMN_044417 [Dreissena polymorpha]